MINIFELRLGGDEIEPAVFKVVDDHNNPIERVWETVAKNYLDGARLKIESVLHDD